MAVRALPPGAIRRRAFFGLLDADGWTAAFLKALFWFLLILFLLGYLPDRAYYFTVSKTIDLGFNAIPLVNLCPASNEDLGCPAPKGAMIPWQTSPTPQLDLPAPRVGAAAFQSGTTLYLIGGEVGGTATADTLVTTVTTDGNLGAWQVNGPALPEPRAGAAFASLSGVPYVIGGRDASGAPSTTVFEGTVDSGILTGWQAVEDLVLPVASSDAMAIPTAAGIYLVGGRTPDGIVATMRLSPLGQTANPTLGAWTDTGVPLPQARASAGAVPIGDNIYVVGGEGPDGVSRDVFRLTVDEGLLIEKDDGTLTGWAIAPPAQALPEPRTRASMLTANGALYVIGGENAAGEPQSTVGWAVPDTLGDLPAWQRLDITDLPEARAGSAIANVGSFAFVIGGEGPGSPVVNSIRANLSPQPPFFRLGMFGATVPALSIQGEIGQQLGYINAFGLGMTNFVVLILIGLAFSHRQGTMRVIERLSRGRVRAPREEEFPAARTR